MNLFKKPLVIKSLWARKILDSRGDWTIEATLEMSDGVRVKSSVPQGKSKGAKEAVYTTPETAVGSINGEISKILENRPLDNQNALDLLLIETDKNENKSRLGANAILAVSMVCAKAGAREQNIPLWKYLSNVLNEPSMTPKAPNLYMNLINGGLHAADNLAFQEYIAITDAASIKEATEVGSALYTTLKKVLEREQGRSSVNLGDEGGYTPALKDNLEPFEYMILAAREAEIDKIGWGLDAAASNVAETADSLRVIYDEAIQKYKLKYIEDPFEEDDYVNFAKMTAQMGDGVVIAGDDITATNPTLMQQALDAKAINGAIIKPNQIGTVSEALEAARFAKKAGWKIIVSQRSGETNDSFIADVAFAVGADGFKLGAPARGERVAKYNRLLEIEAEIAAGGKPAA